MSRITLVNTINKVRKIYKDQKTAEKASMSARGTYQVLDVDLQQLKTTLEDMDYKILINGKPKQLSGQIVDNKKLTYTHLTDPKAIARTKEHFEDKVQWIVLDIDTSDTIAHLPSLAPKSEADVHTMINHIFGDVSYLIKPSSSRLVKGTNNWHIYIPIDGTTTTSRIADHITYKLGLIPNMLCEGIDSAGKVHKKNHFCDMSVYGPERIIYEDSPESDTPYVVPNEMKINDGTISLKPSNLKVMRVKNHIAIGKKHSKNNSKYQAVAKVRTERVEALLRSKCSSEEEYQAEKQQREFGCVTMSSAIRDVDGAWTTVAELVIQNKSLSCYSPFEPEYDHAAATYDPARGTFKCHHTGQVISVVDSKNDTIVIDASAHSYLSEVPFAMIDKNTCLIGPTGFGKSVFLQKRVVPENPGTIVITCVPTLQLLEDFVGRGFKRISSNHDSLIPGQLYVMTYERLATINIAKQSQVTLCLDECHELVNPKSTYRSFTKVWNTITNGDWHKTIWITATVNPQLLPVDRTIIVKHSKLPRKVSIISSIEFLEFMDIKYKHGTGTALCFVENKQACEDFAVDLRTKYPTANIGIATSDFTSTGIQEAVETNDFSAFDIILTTSVMRQGISINTPVQFTLSYYPSAGAKVSPQEAIQECSRDRVSDAPYFLHIGNGLSTRYKAVKPSSFLRSKRRTIKQMESIRATYTTDSVEAMTSINKVFEIFVGDKIDWRKAAHKWLNTYNSWAKQSISNFREALLETEDTLIIDTIDYGCKNTALNKDEDYRILKENITL